MARVLLDKLRSCRGSARILRVSYSNPFILPQEIDCPIKSYSEPYASVQMRPLVYPHSAERALWEGVREFLQPLG